MVILNRMGCPLRSSLQILFSSREIFHFYWKKYHHLIGIKVVYLTDDPIRMKRKWKRDIDYRKKYEPTYFRNRFFKDQFIMAQIAYIPQMAICDLVVDTTGAALWATPEIQKVLAR